MKAFLFFCTVTIVIICAGCEKNPADSKETPTNPREYKWSVDTLAYSRSFQTSMQDIWASSPKDVYVVGHNSQPGPGTMFRFDGTNWKTTGFHIGEGGPIQGPVSLSAIYGFSASDIWIVGEHIYSNPTPPPNFLDSSLAIHFNDSKWTEVNVMPRRQRLQKVWGISSTNLYTVGSNGVVMYYDGHTWSIRLLSPPAQLLYIGGDANRLFTGGRLFGNLSDTLVAFSNVGGQDYSPLRGQHYSPLFSVGSVC